MVRAEERSGAEYETVMRETFGVAGDSWKGFDFDSKVMNGVEDAADDRSRPAPQGPEAAPVPRLRAREALDLLRPRRAGREGARVLLGLLEDVRPQPLSGRLVLRAGRARRRRRRSAATSPTTSSATSAEAASATIWTGEKAQRFREKLAKEPLPICNRCCGNFVYGKWERPQVWRR